MRGKMPLLAAIALFAGPAPAQDVVAEPAPSVAIPCPTEPAPVVMPTTGVPFTLPPDDEAAAPHCAVPLPPPPVRPPAPSLFRMIALPFGNGAPTQKWHSAREDAISEPGPWDELLAQAGKIPGTDPVAMVNQWVNWHVSYRDDPAGDEWAPASATLRRGFGDCEDFALAKMGLLLALGVPSDDMYLVVLRDQRQNDHAVLAVKRDGAMFVLDNRTDKMLPAEAIADYTPVLSFSGAFAWTYGLRAG
ncbi:transglutaminase-like cysteine peptidase [Tsuneonella sp. HG249]